jgi:hypothetical protein
VTGQRGLTRLASRPRHAHGYDYDCNDPTQQCHTVQLWIGNATTGNAQRIYRAPDNSDITSVDWR